MQEDIKCPQCGGNRFKDLGNNTYKCMYCGGTFTHKETVNEPPAAPSTSPSNQPNIIVNVNGHGYDEKSQYAPNNNYHTRPYSGEKSRTTALILCFFLGSFGGHKFYLRQPGWGFLYLIFCWTWIPSIIALIEFIMMLCMSDEEFDYKYN